MLDSSFLSSVEQWKNNVKHNQKKTNKKCAILKMKSGMIKMIENMKPILKNIGLIFIHFSLGISGFHIFIQKNSSTCAE